MFSLKALARAWRCGIAIFPLLLIVPSAPAQTAAKQSAARPEVAGSATPEQRTARAYEAARSNPLELHAFLQRMPKGADLHYHLPGGVYAETYIRDGAQDGLCVDLASDGFVKAQNLPMTRPLRPICGSGQVPAANALTDQNLYDALIDAFSMRNFVPSAGVSAAYHFFDTFDKFSAVSYSHTGEWIDEVASRAAAQNEQYVEIGITPDFSHSAFIAKEVGWNDDLAQMRMAMLAHGLREDVEVARAVEDKAEAQRLAMESCGQTRETPACKVTLRYIYLVLRGFPKEQVFAQTLLAFEIASADPRFVGINYVMAENGKISMEDYALHMKMIGFLHGLYPQVHITLHAGELTEGLVPPESLCCHIRLAVEQAHAERIGHGIDIMHEDRPYELLKEMAEKHVMVETNLTSNDVILGITGKEHPLPIYRKYHVPVALSTDDEGVSRIDMTHEFVRAAETFALHYEDLKQMVRTSVEHSFLPGASLWLDQDGFSRVVSDCAQIPPGGNKFSVGCAVFLKSSQKAQQQWELERRFREFESQF